MSRAAEVVEEEGRRSSEEPWPSGYHSFLQLQWFGGLKERLPGPLKVV